MNVGSLVRRKPEWGEWVKHNPWMYTEKDFEIGMIVDVDMSWLELSGGTDSAVFHVLIGGIKEWYSKNDLVLIR